MPRQMPYRIAMEYALTGEFFSAQRAYELGLVNRLTDGPAIEGAKILAEAISKNGPLAIKASKKTIVESRLWTDEQMWTKQQDIMAPIFASSDAREGQLHLQRSVLQIGAENKLVSVSQAEVIKVGSRC